MIFAIKGNILNIHNSFLNDFKMFFIFAISFLSVFKKQTIQNYYVREMVFFSAYPTDTIYFSAE